MNDEQCHNYRTDPTYGLGNSGTLAAGVGEVGLGTLTVGVTGAAVVGSAIGYGASQLHVVGGGTVADFWGDVIYNVFWPKPQPIQPALKPLNMSQPDPGSSPSLRGKSDPGSKDDYADAWEDCSEQYRDYYNAIRYRDGGKDPCLTDKDFKEFMDACMKGKNFRNEGPP